MGASIIRRGFLRPAFAIIIITNPPSSIGNDVGPYIMKGGGRAPEAS